MFFTIFIPMFNREVFLLRFRCDCAENGNSFFLVVASFGLASRFNLSVFKVENHNDNCKVSI